MTTQELTKNEHDDLWANNKIKDLLFGCILNIKFKNSGLCKKYLCDMTHKEYTEYLNLMSALHE